jgi:tetratricopeptide (TPR) repeat protein
MVPAELENRPVRDLGVSMRFARAALVVALALAAVPPVAKADTTATGKSTGKPAATKAGADMREAKPRLSDYLAGRTAQLDRDWRAAGQYTRRAWEADKDNSGLRHDALLLSLAGGDFAGALEIVHAIPADSSDSELATFVLALDDFAQGRYAVAASKFATTPRAGINHYMIPLLQAWAAVGEGRKEAALSALAPLDGPPEIAAAIDLQKASILDTMGDHAQAGAIFDKLLDNKPVVRAIVAAAYFYERQGASDKARGAIERLDVDGAQSSLRAAMLARLGDKAHVPPPLDARAGAAEVLLEVASTLATQKQADVAPLLYAQFALRLRPNFPSAQLLLAQLDEHWGRFDDAAEVLGGIDEKADFKSTADRLAMAMLERAKEPDKALKFGQSAIKAFPQDVDLALFNADMLRQNQHYPEAIKAYTDLLAKIPATSTRKGVTLFHRGMAYQQSKQWPPAEADLLAALQLRPDDPAILNYLGFSWADQGVNLDRARTMIERALVLVPDDGAIVDSLGWVMFRSGDFEDAVKQLERAVSLLSTDATINDHLGDAYWRVGRQIEARSQWEKAARYSVDKDLLEQIKIKLRDGLEADATPKHAPVN